MSKMIDIDVIIDDFYVNPKVAIYAKNKNSQVESIINAVENVTENEYPAVTGHKDTKTYLISQHDIIRLYIENRKIMMDTRHGTFQSKKKPLSALEEILNPSRFVRISQSEIINIYMVKHFDFDVSGTIGIELVNGTNTWVARRNVKAIKEMLKNINKN